MTPTIAPPVAIAGPAAQDLGTARFIDLVTFRRTGEPVGTPVLFAKDGDRVLVRTAHDAGKLKRLAHTPAVELSPATTDVYLRRAFTQMLEVADRVGEPGINERPLGPETNAIGALIIHCCEVAECWLGHVALLRPTTRQREAEFSRTATLAELHELADAALARALLRGDPLHDGRGGDGGRQFLPDGDPSDASAVLHVLEELFQHLGHRELAADALARR